ncbi:MAG: hypothetical protein Q9227_001885 [Pyrenula ochraceoflavens]
MSGAPGLSHGVIPLAPYPPSSVRSGLPPDEWLLCLDAWILGVESRLKLSLPQIKDLSGSRSLSAIQFLESYTRELAHDATIERFHKPDSKDLALKRLAFLLTRRILLETDTEEDFLEKGTFDFFSNCCVVYRSFRAFRQTFQDAWRKGSFNLVMAVERAKVRGVSLLASIEGFNRTATLTLLRQYLQIIEPLPEVGVIWMTGSDFLDNIDFTFERIKNDRKPDANQQLLEALSTTLYRSLLALTRVNPPQSSLLLDLLFTLKYLNEKHGELNVKSLTVLIHMLCSTPFLKHVQDFFSSSTQKRGSDVLEYMSSIRSGAASLHPTLRKQKTRTKNKGKGQAFPDDDDLHMHSLALVAQVQELFPDLSADYILKLLSYYSDDIEAVTAALLEPDSLPLHLKAGPSIEDRDADGHLTRGEQQTASRRNIFDGDELSNLRISSSQLHFGKRDKEVPQDLLASEKSGQKAAILSALAAFDSDSDERDDTYDVADVGGTVDSTMPGTDDAEARTVRNELQSKAEEDVRQQDQAESVLFQAWRSDHGMFSRDAKTRLSQPRTQLKRETAWTDEQIEGWAVMLQRDQDKLRQLERKFGPGGARDVTAVQPSLERTSWRAVNDISNDSEDAGDEGPPVSGPHRGRGWRGSRGRGRGGNVAGPSNDAATQRARQRKEQGKGGRGGGNHGRREGRARKMARGFGSQT